MEILLVARQILTLETMSQGANVVVEKETIRFYESHSISRTTEKMLSLLSAFRLFSRPISREHNRRITNL